MTTNISEEELLLRKKARRRLVGAIVLVLTAIIVLPAIFDEPKSSNEKQEIAIKLPPSNHSDISDLSSKKVATLETAYEDDPSIEFQNQMKVPGISDEATELSSNRKSIPIPGIKPKIDRSTVLPKDMGNSPTTAMSVNVSPSNNPTVSAPIVPTAAAKGVVIQLGAYSDQAKAKQQHTSLLANGFKVYTEIHNEVTRVRIGPFATRAEAENEIKKLKKIGLDGVIIPR